MHRIPLAPATLRWSFAHRGLHDARRGVVENSFPAFEAAIRAGYGIECDLQPCRDGTPVVFHDATLDRLTSETGLVTARGADELTRLELRGCDPPATIPAFDAMLAFVDGRCPLLVEVKSDWRVPGTRFMTAIASAANAYVTRLEGHAFNPLMLMSFDPAVLAALGQLAPNIARGLVSGSYRNADGSRWWPEVVNEERRRQLADLTDFEAVGASFIAYKAASLPNARVTALRAAGNPVFAWTVRTGAEWETASEYADAPIFEGEL